MPTVSSGCSNSKTVKAEKGEQLKKHVLITRYDTGRAARGEMLNIDDILEILAIPLLGIIPESQDVLKASNVGSPVTLNNAASMPAKAYIEAARRLTGETVAMVVPSEQRKGFHGPSAWTEGGMSMNLLICFAAAPARRRLPVKGCKFSLRTSAVCAASPICSMFCERRFSPWFHDTSCWIRKR